MEHNPKLEIYKLRLFKKKDSSHVKFAEFFRQLPGYNEIPTPRKPADVLKIFYDNFIHKSDNYFSKKNKAFKIAYEKTNAVKKSLLKIDSGRQIIYGILDGGKHSIKRTIGELSDSDFEQKIGTTKVVNDKFYFMLYTPLQENVGILIIQGYTEAKISDIFLAFLKEYFKFERSITNHVEVFIPGRFKDEFLTGATFNSLKFSSGFETRANFDDIKEREYEFKVNIEIISKNKSLSYKQARNVLQMLNRGKFELRSGIGKELENFDAKVAKMKGRNGKILPYTIDHEDNIKPVILLKDIITVTEGLPDFEQMETYVSELLEDIINELEPPENAVQEL
jgi:hypothetical protein